MKFERGKDPKKVLHIGMEEHIIQLMAAHIKEYLYDRMNFWMPPDDDDVIAIWSRNGAYIKLKPVQHGFKLLTSDSKYPGYYIEYDTGGMHFGNCTIEMFLEKPNRKSTFADS